MFGRDRFESSFSVMLAEEVLRAELQKQFGKICVFQRVIKPGKVEGNSACKGDCSKPEMDQRYGAIWERLVTFECIIGSPSANAPLMRVEAHCRVYSVGGQKKPTNWQPHYLNFGVFSQTGERLGTGCKYYVEGWVSDGTFTVVHGKNADNPCQAMCDGQFYAVVPALAPALHEARVPVGPVM
jgi:hypothetical protein